MPRTFEEVKNLPHSSGKSQKGRARAMWQALFERGRWPQRRYEKLQEKRKKEHEFKRDREMTSRDRLDGVAHFYMDRAR